MVFAGIMPAQLEFWALFITKKGWRVLRQKQNLKEKQ